MKFLTQYLTSLCLIIFSILAHAAPRFSSFKTWQEAEDSRAIIYKVLESEMPPGISPDDTLYQKQYLKLRNMIKVITQGFRQVYPDEMSLVPSAPQVIITNTESLNAMAIKNETFGNPLIIEVAKKVMDQDLGFINGLIAHELAHSFLQWESTDRFPKELYYMSGNLDFKYLFTGEIPFNTNLENKMEQWKFYASFAGKDSHTVFRGMPYSYDTDSKSDFLMLFDLIKKSDNKLACDSTMEKFNEMSATFFDLSAGNLLNTMDASTLQKTSQKVSALEERVKSCLNTKMSLVKIASDFYSTPIEGIQSAIESLNSKGGYQADFTNQALSFFSNYNAGEAFLKTSELAREKMRVLECSMNFEDVRLYTDEDHADAVSIKVLSHLGLSSSGRFSALSYNGFSAKCSAVPTEEPNYGPIDWKHHSSCWRWWRAVKLEDYLKNNH